MEEAIDYDADELEEQVVAPPLGAEMDAGQLLADLESRVAKESEREDLAAEGPVQLLEDEDGEIVEADSVANVAATTSAEQSSKATGGGGSGGGGVDAKPTAVTNHRDAVERMLAVAASEYTKILLQLKIILDVGAKNRAPVKRFELQGLLKLSDETFSSIMFWGNFNLKSTDIIGEGNMKKLFSVCSDLSSPQLRRQLETSARDPSKRGDAQLAAAAEAAAAAALTSAGAKAGPKPGSKAATKAAAKAAKGLGEGAALAATREEGPIITCAVRFKALPSDTSATEIAAVIKSYVPLCDYTMPEHIDLSMGRSDTGAEVVVAEVLLRKPHDANAVKQKLQGEVFGGFTLDIDFCTGKPWSTIWLGVPVDSTDESVKAICAPYGRVLEINTSRKRKEEGKSRSAFVTFSSVFEARAAMEGLTRAAGGEGKAKVGYAIGEVEGSGQPPNADQMKPATAVVPRRGSNEREWGADSRDRDRDRERDRNLERERIVKAAVPPPDHDAVDKALTDGLRYLLLTNVLGPTEVEDLCDVALRSGPHMLAFIVRIWLILPLSLPLSLHCRLE